MLTQCVIHICCTQKGASAEGTAIGSQVRTGETHTHTYPHTCVCPAAAAAVQQWQHQQPAKMASGCCPGCNHTSHTQRQCAHSQCARAQPGTHCQQQVRQPQLAQSEREATRSPKIWHTCKHALLSRSGALKTYPSVQTHTHPTQLQQALCVCRWGGGGKRPAPPPSCVWLDAPSA